MKRLLRRLRALASGLVMFSVGVGALPASADSGPAPKLWQLPPEPYFTALDAEPADVQDAIALYQPYFDQFSWMTFTALNWPATKDGEPDTDQFIGANVDDVTVWEHWMNADDLFREGGGKPAPWGRAFVPYKCGPIEPDKDGTIPSGEYLIFTSRDDSEFVLNVPTSSNMVHSPKRSPLVDQNGMWARFESYVSKPSYDFIVQNNLHTAQGQEAFRQSGKTLQLPVGSMEIKVVWKVLGKDEENQLPSPPYHTRKAVFFLGDNKCKVAQVGLVAMHILTRTAQMPTGIWSTFDHVNNLCTPESPRPAPDAKPPNPEVSKQCLLNSPPPKPWRSGNFCNGDCMTNPSKPGCAPNQSPPEPWLPPADPTQPGTMPPSQVVRVRPIPIGSTQASSLFSYLFKQTDRYSVWRNYQLIGTQWILNLMSNSNTAGTRRSEVSPGDGPAPQYTPRMDAAVEDVCNLAVPCFSRKCPGLVVPTFLGNPMLETYAQKGASCFGCHQMAKTSAGQDADFSWLFARVRRPTNP